MSSYTLAILCAGLRKSKTGATFGCAQVLPSPRPTTVIARSERASEVHLLTIAYFNCALRCSHRGWRWHYQTLRNISLTSRDCCGWRLCRTVQTMDYEYEDHDCTRTVPQNESGPYSVSTWRRMMVEIRSLIIALCIGRIAPGH